MRVHQFLRLTNISAILRACGIIPALVCAASAPVPVLLIDVLFVHAHSIRQAEVADDAAC